MPREAGLRLVPCRIGGSARLAGAAALAGAFWYALHAANHAFDTGEAIEAAADAPFRAPATIDDIYPGRPR